MLSPIIIMGSLKTSKHSIPHCLSPLIRTISTTHTRTPTKYIGTCQVSHLGSSIQPKHILFHLLRSTNTTNEAKSIHGLLLVHGSLNRICYHNVVLGSQLVNTYVRLDCLNEALLLFEQLPKRNSFAWNSILKGFVDAGQFWKTIEFYRSMVGEEGVKPDNYTYPLVFKACSALFDLDLARKMYESMHAEEGVKPNIFVDCTLVDMFAKCGSLGEAKSVFERMPQRDIVTWGAMIGGAIECGDSGEALALFRRMIMDGFRPDSVIIATVLPLCGRFGDLHVGMCLHSWGIKSGIDSDLCLSNALLDMYCKCRQTHEARQVFSRMECRDVISWSSLIAGHSQNCEYAESLHLYMQMKGSGLKPSTITIASVLPAFAEKRLFKEGKAIHGYVIRNGFVSDTFVSSSLIDLYSKCGSLGDAEQAFEAASDKDITIWNSMIMGYTANGDVEVAFRMLRRIHDTKLFKPNSVTLVTVLPLCNRPAMLRQGQECHGYAIRGGFESVTSVQNSLIDMYCKCGYIGLGQNAFDQMERRDVVTYNTIIAALGMHGHGNQALALFETMKSEGIRPDKVTFIALLSACSHAGLVEKGRSFYHSMIEEHGIVPDMEHYSCMVDLFGRSGCIKEAWEFIRSMPVKADIDVLGSLLGACRVHDQLELAEQIGREIFDRNPDDPGYHVLLSNAYAAAGMWEDSMRVRMMFTGRGLVKKPANSWIQGRRGFHAYIARG